MRYNIASTLRQLYWFILRPTTRGVKCLIMYRDKCLLIKNSYSGDVWTLPGGGVRIGEDPDAAVSREVGEEVGIALPDFYLLGQYLSTKEYKRNTVHCYYSSVKSAGFVIDDREVIEATWFGLQAGLPDQLSFSAEYTTTLFTNRA